MNGKCQIPIDINVEYLDGEVDEFEDVEVSVDASMLSVFAEDGYHNINLCHVRKYHVLYLEDSE